MTTKKLNVNKETARKIRQSGVCAYRDGREIHDPVPLEVPARLRGVETMEEKLQRIINVSLARKRIETAIETAEDAIDFGEDEMDPEEYATTYQYYGMDIPIQPAQDEIPQEAEATGAQNLDPDPDPAGQPAQNIPPTPGGDQGGVSPEAAEPPPLD